MKKVVTAIAIIMSVTMNAQKKDFKINENSIDFKGDTYVMMSGNDIKTEANRISMVRLENEETGEMAIFVQSGSVYKLSIKNKVYTWKIGSKK